MNFCVHEAVSVTRAVGPAGPTAFCSATYFHLPECPGGNYLSLRFLQIFARSHDTNPKCAFFKEGFVAARPTLLDGKTHIVVRVPILFAVTWRVVVGVGGLD